MKIFLTGATGFIGTALVPELINAGHQVLGLARSDDGAKRLIAAGAKVHRGSLEHPSSLRLGAAGSDGVIHCAYDHDFSTFEESGKKESRAIDALGSALIGTDRPLIITSVTAMGAAAPGRIATEDYYIPNHPIPRTPTENAGAAVADRGVNVSVVRLPQVHNKVKQGLISQLIGLARDKGVSAYVEEGVNRWPAVHLLDVARLYRLAFEKHEPSSRYNAVAEEGIPLRQIAEAIGKLLQIPVVSIRMEEAQSHFGWLAMFAGMDMPASSQLTRQRLGWHPTGPGLLSDLERDARTDTQGGNF
ncbi:SDR family oxidoreductase [Sodalis ligni]|uniref:Nucleoside-diphosphate-sugar epimerase n=1 Tax=Sodalis ligni TaxID=2697027 RepID=A0A4R1NIC8_9GAMM|nr:SDR family oxidoreductase [Sodalis ligni]TCL06809.1 nucleoside-diphosphate-sugar epimerase [Sodalis ligni]